MNALMTAIDVVDGPSTRVEMANFLCDLGESPMSPFGTKPQIPLRHIERATKRGSPNRSDQCLW
jgi:hypothetical protein